MHAATPWGGAPVSRLWSAKGDERCAPPHSDDYKEWSLMQLKREITQRQLKTNPRRRNKDAFVRILLHHDEEQQPPNQMTTPNQTTTQTCHHLGPHGASTRHEIGQDPVVFVACSTAEGPAGHVSTTGDQQLHDVVYVQQQQEVYGDPVNREGPMAPLPPPTSTTQVFAAVEGMQAVPLVPAPAAAVCVPTVSLLQSQNSASGALGVVAAAEDDVDAGSRSRNTKRRRIEVTAGRESEQAPMVAQAAAGPGDSITATSTTNSQQSESKMSNEYFRRKLSLQAARLEQESRRLELETKREERQSELHTVHLALAQEQLQQAKLTTQKMKTEWIVEQMVQKKKLSDAGISREDSAASLGPYLS
uniref:Uncharacterized protein n=1 Tax=Peronospora matthiolae TaxID=2874970 RepID=A0AAV1V6K4_9STRA